ncbi:MAG TPA: DNA recombination protein RmuC [Acidisarcina sp.]
MNLFRLFAFLPVAVGVGLLCGFLISRRRAAARAAERDVEQMLAHNAAMTAAQSASVAAAQTQAALLREREQTIQALREELAEAQTGRARAEEQGKRLPELRDEIALLRAGRDGLQERYQASERELAQVSANLENERRQSSEKLAMLTGVIASSRQELTDQFKTLASEILDEKSKRFTAENQTSIGHLLDPLKTRLTEFQAKVEEVQKEGLQGRTELKTHIGELKCLNERLSSDATNLVNALKGSSKAQGDWGEFILERILEASGLRKGYDYRVQESFAAEEGRRGRPDVVIDLRDGHHLVIDAKVSLVDYNDYCNCNDQAKRDAALGRHLASVRGHIKELSKRGYQSLYGLKSLDFVVMFVPIEPAFMLAISGDEKIWEEAWNKSILLVGPSTLMFVIRIVDDLRRQQTQVLKVQEIFNRGRDLYDKLAAFAKDLSEVGTRLNAARDSYDEAVKKLSTGKGNAIRQAEMLKELGVKPTKMLPASMLGPAMDSSLEQPSLLNSMGAVEAEYLPAPEDLGPVRSRRIAAEVSSLARPSEVTALQ